MDFKLPSFLRDGDQVAVVATARVVDQSSVKKALGIIRSWGLEVTIGEALFSQDQLFAGSDKERIEDLQEALDSPSIKAIFCARGGYGTTRILDKIDWRGFIAAPKWICGFSDITALLSQLLNQGYCCVHSTMPQLFGNPGAEPDYESLREYLFGKQEYILQVKPHRNNRNGHIQAPVVGGNLSLLVHSIGTSSEVHTDGKILCLEEVDEYMYHLDRMMVQLKRCGKLQGLRGAVVGHLTKIKEGELSFGTSAEALIADYFPTDIPIAFGFPFGHQSPNLALPLGCPAQLTVNKTGSVLSF